MRLSEGGCDLLIAYHHPSQPLQLNPERYDMLVLGRETLAPFSCANARGRAVYTLPGEKGQRIPFLNYAPGAYLARLVDLIVKESPQAAALAPVYETDMAEGLKAMAIEGHGLTFLPVGSVQKELRAGRLVEAAPEDSFRLTMEVRIYRERPGSGAGRPAKAAAQGLWAYLEAPQDP
jgi:DNA-binding transcriptional LysR family regulator